MSAPALFDLVVTARNPESRDVVSLVLAAPDGGVLPAFTAGQHLVLRLDLPARPLATYTISSAPQERRHYRISVKREAGGKGGSCWLHDDAPLGTTLQAHAPRGSFVVADPAKPLLFLTGGIGITPALSMLQDHLTKPQQRPVMFIHACNSPAETSFAAILADIAAAHPQVKIILTHAQDGQTRAHRAGEIGLAQGFVTRELLQQHLPLDDYDSYLCGPPAFMAAMRDLLRDLGRPDASIRQESFGTAPAAVPLVQAARSEAPLVRFAASAISAPWQDCDTLLDFAEAQGLAPDFSCRAGVCGSCSCALQAGAVDYVIDPLEPPEEGHVLLCCAKPRGDIVLAL